MKKGDRKTEDDYIKNAGGGDLKNAFFGLYTQQISWRSKNFQSSDPSTNPDP